MHQPVTGEPLQTAEDPTPEVLPQAGEMADQDWMVSVPDKDHDVLEAGSAVLVRVEEAFTSAGREQGSLAGSTT